MPKWFDSTRAVPPKVALASPAVRERLGLTGRQKPPAAVRLRGVLGCFSVGGGIAVDGVFLADAESELWTVDDGPIESMPLTLLIALPLAPLRPSQSVPGKMLASPRQRRFPGRFGDVIELDAVVGVGEFADEDYALCVSPVRFLRDDRLEAALFEQIVETDDLGPLRRSPGNDAYFGWVDWLPERHPNERRVEVTVAANVDRADLGDAKVIKPAPAALRRLRSVLADAAAWRARIDRVVVRDMLARVNDGIAQTNEWNAEQGHDLHRDPLSGDELTSLLAVTSVDCFDPTAVSFSLVTRPSADSIDPEHCVRVKFATARSGQAYFD